MKQKAKQQHPIVRETGEFKGSRKRWWLQAKQERSYASEDQRPEFQRYQFDAELGGRPRFEESPPSPKAYAFAYGDSSLDRHVEKILEGIHEEITACGFVDRTSVL